MDNNVRKIAQEELEKEIKQKTKITAYRVFTLAKYMAIVIVVIFSEKVAYKNRAFDWLVFTILQIVLAVVFIATVSFLSMFYQAIKYGLKDNLEGTYNIFHLCVSIALIISFVNIGIFGSHIKTDSLYGITIGVLMLIHLFGNLKYVPVQNRLVRLDIKIKQN